MRALIPKGVSVRSEALATLLLPLIGGVTPPRCWVCLWRRLPGSGVEIDDEVEVAGRLPELRRSGGSFAPVIRAVVDQVGYRLPQEAPMRLALGAAIVDDSRADLVVAQAREVTEDLLLLL